MNQDNISESKSGTSNGKNPTLSIVIPAFNEEDGIIEIIERVLAIQPALEDVGIAGMELIVVDDGSHDRTSQIVSSCPGARLIRHPTNKGYGAALKTGFQASAGSLLGFLDADGTYPPEYFPQLCQAALQGADMVVGSRRSGASSEMPLVRRIGNLLWSKLVSLLSGQQVIDPASGMRIFRSEALEKLYPLPDGLNFTPVMSTRAVHENVKLVEIPIPYKERVGRSKLNIYTDGIRFLQTILWTALNYNPVRILGGVGAGMIAVAGLIGVIIAGMRISGITYLGPWGVIGAFAAVVLLISGVDLLALGITFNYLVSLFHRRPVRQGLFSRTLLRTPIEDHFWWMGVLLALIGLVINGVSFILASGAWTIERLWLYLLTGTMLILLGVQLFIFWVIVQVLSQLSQRESQVLNDLGER